MIKQVNPRGKEGYWISVSGDAEDGGPGTDFHAVMQGYVSITPLQLDRTFHEAFADIVALFQHFTFPEILRHQIAHTRGALGAHGSGNVGDRARSVESCDRHVRIVARAR